LPFRVEAKLFTFFHYLTSVMNLPYCVAGTARRKAVRIREVQQEYSSKRLAFFKIASPSR
jgi:hypothetical protein